MAATFPFRLLTPNGIVFEGDAAEVSAIGPLGEFGILPEHINFITSLVPGVLEAQLPDGTKKHWVVSGGLAEVKDSVMTVLANSAESPESVDPSAAAEEVKEADQKFSTMSFYDPNYAAVQDALKLAEARLEAAAMKSTAR